MNAHSIIEKLQLNHHPEGGYYRETYRAEQIIKTINGEERNVSTAIYYLLQGSEKSAFHRIRSDELWFFHGGNSMEIVVIDKGEIITITLGSDIENGEVLQATITANAWFAAKIKSETSYSLVSCMVAPGFDFLDFELANRASLINQYPQLKDVIVKFTNP